MNSYRTVNKNLTLRERKRAAIIDAAILEFREKGFQATSMDALAARAEVSKRTVYNHFASKELLFQELVQQMFEVACASGAYTYDKNMSLKEQLTRFGHHKIELLQSQRFLDLARILMVECVHDPKLADEARQRFEQSDQGLDRWIEKAIADGRMKSVEPAYAANQFFGLIKASAFWPQLLMNHPFPDPQTAEFIIRDTVEMFLSHYEKAGAK